MSWQFVFNSALGTHYDMQAAQCLAGSCGYKFFVWNNYVYLSADKSETGIKYTDLW